VNPPRDFPMLLELYKAKRLNLRDLITRRYPLEQINEAFTEMNRGEVARSIVVM
jgi:S-(hydroxymethyl)glutathione dehydrogenase/alcohol dehydrogenase